MLYIIDNKLFSFAFPMSFKSPHFACDGDKSLRFVGLDNIRSQESLSSFVSYEKLSILCALISLNFDVVCVYFVISLRNNDY